MSWPPRGCGFACTRRARSQAARAGATAASLCAAGLRRTTRPGRSSGASRRGALWQLTERYVERLAELAGDAFRRTGSLRLAADESERVELEAEYEALREDGFAAEWRDDVGEPLAGRFHGAIFHPPDGALQPARWVRRLAGAGCGSRCRAASAQPSRVARRARCRARGRSHGRLHVGAQPCARRCRDSNPRSGRGHRTARPARLPASALRPARVRLLAANAGRAARRRRLPGQGAGPGEHSRGNDDPTDPGPPRALRRRAARRAAARSPIAGPGSSG